jgi:hypothetical protein
VAQNDGFSVAIGKNQNDPLTVHQACQMDDAFEFPEIGDQQKKNPGTPQIPAQPELERGHVPKEFQAAARKTDTGRAGQALQLFLIRCVN